MDLHDYLEKNSNILMTLSLFLLLTFTAVTTEALLNNVIGIVSALISYILLLGLVSPTDFRQGSFLPHLLMIVLLLFIPAFCVWVILNLVTTLSGSWSTNTQLILWLVLMLIPSLRLFIGK